MLVVTQPIGRIARCARVRAKPDFLSPIKLILPVQSCLQKYFA